MLTFLHPRPLLTPSTPFLLPHTLLKKTNPILKPTVGPYQTLCLPTESPRPHLRLIELLLQIVQLLLKSKNTILLARAGSLGGSTQLMQPGNLKIGDRGTEAVHNTDQGVSLLLSGDGLPGEVPAELRSMDRNSRRNVILRSRLLREDLFQCLTVGQSFRPRHDDFSLRCAHQPTP
ncbi:hypothetical protein [Streptomyces sp. NPDC127038]|uniref:hypothetical protein n=1 Tax=Streptomyces sp. NPDC127038 TaxID=3347114 RepID=UPI0036600BC0